MARIPEKVILGPEFGDKVLFYSCLPVNLFAQSGSAGRVRAVRLLSQLEISILPKLLEGASSASNLLKTLAPKC